MINPFMVVRRGHKNFDSIHGKDESDFYVISVHKTKIPAESKMIKVSKAMGERSNLYYPIVYKVDTDKQYKKGDWLTWDELRQVAYFVA